MLSVLCARTAPAARALERCASSVVELPKLPEFGVANEPVLQYRAGSRERAALAEELQRTAAVTEEVPIVIGDDNIRDGEPRYQVMPHDHSRKIAKFYYASEKTGSDKFTGIDLGIILLTGSFLGRLFAAVTDIDAGGVADDR